MLIKSYQNALAVQITIRHLQIKRCSFVIGVIVWDGRKDAGWRADEMYLIFKSYSV